MVNKTCPHLGRRDDPSTIFNYPSVGNFCHHARPLAPPSEDHQFEYCLSGRCRECPIFKAPTGKRLPPSIQMPDWNDPDTLSGNILQRVSFRQLSAILFLGVAVLLGGVFMVFAWSEGYLTTPSILAPTSTLIPTRLIPTPTFALILGTEAVLAPAETPFPPEPTVSSSPTEAPSVILPPTSTPIFTSIPSTPTQTPTQVCTLPPGWVTYIVRAGDTLSSISAATGTTISQLQQANCLGTTTQIFTGQRLFVPKLPDTPTAVVFSTFSPTLPTGTLTPSQTPTLTSIPSTATLVPPSPTNTAIPPTETPNSSPTPVVTPTKADEATLPPSTNTPSPH